MRIERVRWEGGTSRRGYAIVSKSLGSGRGDDSLFRGTVAGASGPSHERGCPTTPGHRLRTTRGTGGGGRRVLPPQLDRVRLERPSRARPNDITHKAPRGRLRDRRGCQNSPPVSSPQIPLYRRGMSRVSLIAQHFVRLRRRSAVFSQAVNILMRSSGSWLTPPQDAVEASLDNPLDNPLDNRRRPPHVYISSVHAYILHKL